MNIDKRIINTLLWTVYGDALGFLKTNTNIEIEELKEFTYIYNNDLHMGKNRGQYSYITELILINIKSLIDSSKTFEVNIDYNRFFEELKLWFYYRHGKPGNLLKKLSDRKYYNSNFYWKDVRGYGISRVFPIAIANKNYNSLEREVYKNIIYLNRHPRVILSGLLLSRTVYLLLEKNIFEKEEIIKELKDYLIHLQFNELNRNISIKLPNDYRIQFEREKINYLLEIDKLKDEKDIKNLNWDARAILLYGLDILFRLENKEDLKLTRLNIEDLNEVLAIGYGLWGIINKKELKKLDILKDGEFLKNMGDYLYRLRNFRVNRKVHKKSQNTIDLFQLNKGQTAKHELLGPIKVLDRIETSFYIQILLNTKSGSYTLIQNKKRQ